MHWKFWIALCVILISVGIVVGFNLALYMQGVALTISGAIVTIISVVPAVVSSLNLFQTWNKNRKEEERIPALEFDGFFFREGTTIDVLPLAGWIATTYIVRVRRKNRGIGRAEQCEGVVALTDSPFNNMRSRWMPDSVLQSDIGGHMDLFLFQIIPVRGQIVFSPALPDGRITLVDRPLEEDLDRLLIIEIHTGNANPPEPLRKTVREIMNEAQPF
jgi:hypothetical protein